MVLAAWRRAHLGATDGNRDVEGGDAMTPPEIAERLRALSEEMEAIACAIDYYGGFAEWAKRRHELTLFRVVARVWANEIDAENKSTSLRTPKFGFRKIGG